MKEDNSRIIGAFFSFFSWFQLIKYGVILLNLFMSSQCVYQYRSRTFPSRNGRKTWLQSVCAHLSDNRKGQMSGTGGVAGRSLASAMMCSKVMSVCVQTSARNTSCGAPPWLTGARRRTWTTMGSRLMASTTASSWSTLEKLRPFTWEGMRGPKSSLSCWTLWWKRWKP